MTARARRLPSVSILLLACCAFLLFLGRQDVTNTHEARVAQTARRMAASGWPWDATPVEVPAVRLARDDGTLDLQPDRAAPQLRVNPWIVPVLGAEIRLQKPPLPYWYTAVLFRLMGESEWAVRGTPALLGVLAALLLWDTARLLLGRVGALFASLVWASTYALVIEFRAASADPCLAFFCLACLWAWVRATHAARTHARTRTPARVTLWLLAFYVFLALALLSKGPVAFVHVALALAAYHACYRQRPPRPILAHLAGVILLIALTLPWPLAVMRQVPGALALWRYESVGELAENTRNAVPWWGYLPKLPYLALPWTPLWAVGIAYVVWRVRGATPETKGRRRRLLFPLAWYAAAVVFFSFVNLKKDAYLLPVMPAQSLLVAQFATAAVAWSRLRRRPPWLDALRAVQSWIAVGFAGAVLVLLVRTAVRPLATDLTGHPRTGPLAVLAAVALPVALALAAAALLPRRSPTHWRRALAFQAIAFILFTSVFLNTYMTDRENARSPRRTAALITGFLHATDTTGAASTLYAPSVPPVLAFYLPLDAPPLSSADRVLVVAGKEGVKPETIATVAQAAGRPVEETRKVQISIGAAGERWTLYELKLRNSPGPGAR